jgi:hypothetical protein
MWRRALGRLAAIFALVVAATAGISVVIGALAHRNLAHSVAVGFYILGCCALVGTLGYGLRGPNRKEYDERPEGQSSFFRVPRRVRRTTGEERAEGRRNALVLFAFGLILIVIGAAIDPTRSLA